MKLKTVGSLKFLYVMAAKPEFGTHLQQLCTPLFTGIGPVEAAIALSKALNDLSEKPDYVISLGSAGSAKLEQTKVYQVNSVSYRDMDASPLGFEKGVTPLLDLPKTIDLKHSFDGIKNANLSTGASVISGAAYSDIDADMVDMETFALLRVCMLYDIDLIGLRGISDGKDELKQLTDWTQYLDIVDKELATAARTVEQALLRTTNSVE